jgi:hypothetical protein
VEFNKLIGALYVIIFIFCLIAFSDAKAADGDKWRMIANTTEYVGYVAIVADYLQTVQIRDREGLEEQNAWLYGKQPTRERVSLVMGLQLVGLYVFNNHMYVSNKFRAMGNTFVLVPRLAFVHNNYELGLKIKF